MLRLPFQHLLVVLDRSILVIRKLLEGLAKTKVGVDIFRIDFQGVPEVLASSLSLAQVCKQIS